MEAVGKPLPDAYQGSSLPLHEHCLFKLSVHLGELWYLADLARWLRAQGRSRFLLTAPPLRLPGAVGSPVTPIATVLGSVLHQMPYAKGLSVFLEDAIWMKRHKQHRARSVDLVKRVSEMAEMAGREMIA